MSEKPVSEELEVCFDPDGFRKDCLCELGEQFTLLLKVQKSLGRVWGMHLIAVALLSLAILFIFLNPEVLYLWIIFGLLLYSYNYLILFIPTTTAKARPQEVNVFKARGKYDNWFSIRLLSKKRKLAIEIGLTVFLGGMVPLLLSFSIIFGLALFFAIYFAGFTDILEWNVATAMVLQIVLILGFFSLIYKLQPESQGITRFARTIKGRYAETRSAGRKEFILFIVIVVLIVMVSAILVVGAMLLPGLTIGTLWNHLGLFSIVALLLVAVVQLFVMRHFQAMQSRKMALRLLNMRIECIKTEILAPLDALVLRVGIDEEQFEAEFFQIRKKFYSLAIYDVFESDLFGRSPVFLVGPRLKYLLNDVVLNHFNDKTDGPA